MLERSYDTAFINKVVNDPAVRPYVGSGVDGDIDTQMLADDPDNWFLMANTGFLFCRDCTRCPRSTRLFCLGARRMGRRRKGKSY